jgi:TonB family protein
VKSRVNIITITFVFLALTFSLAQFLPVQAGKSDFPAAQALLISRKSETEWKRVNPQGEEFSILTPVTTHVFKQGGGYTLRDEYVLDHRSYGGYADGFVFFIESYKADRPKNLLKVFEDVRSPLRDFERNIEISGFSGKQYRLTNQNFFGKYLIFVTKKHVHAITLASRDENSASLARFISALIFGDNVKEPATGQVLDVRESQTYKSAAAGESDTTEVQVPVYRPQDVSRKAAIIARPEPPYTEEARRNREKGTVVLRGVLGADGQVTSLRVRAGLKDGLTEKAIEAALALRFFPAEKDGQPVSQYIQIEYNFNLY